MRARFLTFGETANKKEGRLDKLCGIDWSQRYQYGLTGF